MKRSQSASSFRLKGHALIEAQKTGSLTDCPQNFIDVQQGR
jgi:hypothetical protein